MIQNLIKIQKLLSSGEINLSEIVQNYLDQINLNNGLNAFVHVFDDAIDEARKLETKIKNGKTPGKLYGCIFSIKDNICIKGKPVSAASKILKGYVSPYHATVIERILDEDAIIIGTTNCDEFGMGSTTQNTIYGPVKNGADPNLIAGGSSGGAAVSVQTNCCLIALGSDTGGSIRQPASLCNVIGYKPSYGMISRWGLIAYASSFDQIGIISKDIDALNTTFHVIKGLDNYDSTMVDFQSKNQSLDQIQIALIPEMFDPQNAFTEKCKGAIKESLHFAKFQEAEFHYMKYLVPCYYILTTAEASSNLSRYDGVRYGYRANDVKNLDELYKKSRTEGFGEEVKKRIMLGTFVLSEGYFDAYFEKAQKLRRKITNQFTEILKENDFVAMPVTPTPAWPLDKKIEDPTEIYLADIYTVLANIVGLPAITIPVKYNGEIVNYQIIGRRGEDVNLLALAQMITSSPIL